MAEVPIKLTETGNPQVVGRTPAVRCSRRTMMENPQYLTLTANEAKCCLTNPVYLLITLFVSFLLFNVHTKKKEVKRRRKEKKTSRMSSGDVNDQTADSYLLAALTSAAVRQTLPSTSRRQNGTDDTLPLDKVFLGVCFVFCPLWFLIFFYFVPTHTNCP